MVFIPVKEIEFKGNTYRILQRKKAVGRKSLHYLFDIKRKRYLSSLYPVEGDGRAFWFDDREKKYILRVFEKGYKIEEWSGVN